VRGVKESDNDPRILAPLINPGIDGEAHQKLEDGTQVGVSYGDAQYRIGLLEFYQDYHNHVMAFDLGFRCCQVYEAAEKRYTPQYLHNMCHYLKKNKELNVDSLSMIYRSLML
jgi:hypothetical protein